MERLLDEIYRLELDRLTEKWVDSVFLDEFTVFDDIPEEYQSILDSIEIQTVFENLLANIDDIDLEENTWANLSQVIAVRYLLAVIGYHIKLGVDQIIISEFRDCALLAARVYFKLLMIPGARTYNVYHSQLFANTISCLGFPRMMCERSNQFGNSRNLAAEVNKLLRALSEYVVDLKDTILLLKLTPDDINFEDILSNLLDVTGGSITQTLASVDKIVMSNVSGMIYHVINCMICAYGDRPNPQAIKMLFQCMMPKLIAVSGDTKTTSNIVRASLVTYAGFILTSYGKASVKHYTTLLEYLCFNADSLERAELRNVRSEMVVGLMSLMSDKVHRDFVRWVLLLSTTTKVQHRLIALEILSRLLNNEPEIHEQRATIWSEIEKQRAAAEALRAVTSDHSYVRPSDEDSSEDSQQSKENEEPENEEEVAGVMRLEAHTVPLSCILSAVLECAADASSSVRTRAYAVLAESVASERAHMRTAIQELKGDGETPCLVEVAARGLCDERALVRRGAVQLMLRLLHASPRAIETRELTMLVRLCRDAAITVRTAAINAVVELVARRPSAVVVDAFASGPMPQLLDPEAKVADTVKMHIFQLTIKRIAKHVPGNSAEDQLPWRVLQSIIDRQMKRHLEIACQMLARTETCISVRLVDILSSHMGVSPERDLQCLVLLNCVAPHVAYSDLGFVIDIYYKLTREPDPESPAPAVDPRVLWQTLELLISWAQYMKAPDRAALRAHLVTRLATGPDDGTRLQSIILTRALDPTNIIWATELMQLSEQRAVETQCLKEALRAADLSLVSPTPPLEALLQLLLTCVQRPPPECSSAMLGTLVVSAGRLSLRSRRSAEAAAPALAHMLHAAAAPLEARCNALQVLADITQRYSSLVEPLMNQMCLCLRRSEPARLRREAVHVITQLLLNGFLRLRDSLYYKYVALLADSCSDVREPVEYLVTSHLTPDVIFHNFVDCVMRYNQAGQEDDLSLDFEARQVVYDVMLQRLTVVQKLNMQCRLTREVLLHAAELADAEEEIPPELHNALLDTVRILIGPRMRLPRKPQPMGDTINIEDLQERVTNNIVSHKMKRTVAEVMVPAVMRLYARLAAQGGQLAAYLVMLVEELEREYHQEILELLTTDEVLVERMQMFRDSISVERGAGNPRNLVAASGPPEPETPRPPRRRPARRNPLNKRSLNI